MRWGCPFGHCVTQLGAISLVWCLGGVGAGAAERRARVVPQALLAGQRPWNKSTCDASVSASCVASLNCTIPGASVATKWMGTGRGEQRAEGDRVAQRGRVSGAPHGASEPAACAVPAGPPRAPERPTHLKAGTPANQSHTNQGEWGTEGGTEGRREERGRKEGRREERRRREQASERVSDGGTDGRRDERREGGNEGRRGKGWREGGRDG